MDGDLDKQGTERTPQKCFRCGSEDNIIAKCTKPPKDNKKRQNQVRFSDGWMDGWMDGWIEEWMDGWMDGCMYGWMDASID